MNNSFELSWENFTVNVAVKDMKFWKTKINRKCILDNVSGSIMNRSMVAIMGPSGAGKTTLLAAMAGRLKDKEGILKMNQTLVTDQDMKNMSGYMYQSFMFIGSLTVDEHMHFMAALKLNDICRTKRITIINELLQELSLLNCKNSYLKVLSGGEKKRLSLATEFLNNPDLLFCDEPTTGLDSYSAILVVEKLKEKINTGKLVVVTIHQPSIQIFEYFTHVIIVSSGKILYQGKSENANYILQSNYLHGFISFTSLENCINSVKKDEEHYRDLPQQSNGWLSNKNKQLIWPKNLELNNTITTEIIWLLWRIFVDIRRNFMSHLVQFGFLMISALIVSTIYKGITLFDVNSKQNITGLLYFLTTELLFTHIYIVINTFPGELCIFLQEKELYSVHSYFISKVISMIPRNFIQSSIYLGVICVLVNFLSDFFLYLKMAFTLFIACTASSVLGLCISAHFNSTEYMDLFLVPFDAFSLIITGAIIKVPALPTYIMWMKYISPFSFAYESLAILQWTSVDYIELSTNETVVQETGKNILNDLGYSSDLFVVLWNILYLLLLSLITCIFGYLGLIKKKNKYYTY